MNSHRPARDDHVGTSHADVRRIRNNFLGEGSLKSRFAEWMIGLMTPSAETYAQRLAPLLVSPDLEGHSGAMFDRKGQPIMPSPKLTDESHVNAFIAASEGLLSRANVRVAS